MLPIDPKILFKQMEIPEKIAQLSYIDLEKAIKYMRIWGEKKMPITPLYDELNEELSLLSQ